MSTPNFIFTDVTQTSETNLNKSANMFPGESGQNSNMHKSQVTFSIKYQHSHQTLPSVQERPSTPLESVSIQGSERIQLVHDVEITFNFQTIDSLYSSIMENDFILIYYKFSPKINFFFFLR